MPVLLTKYCSGDKIEKKEMGGACSAYGGEKRHTGFWFGNLMERHHLEDPGVEGWIFRKWDVGVWTGSIWLRTGRGGGHL